jgi:hypothetical protein
VIEVFDNRDGSGDVSYLQPRSEMGALSQNTTYIISILRQVMV